MSSNNKMPESRDSEEVQEASETCVMDISKRISTPVYEEEWAELGQDGVDLERLRGKALRGELRASRLRSVAWRLLLGALTPGEPSLWSQQASLARAHYARLKEGLSVTPTVTPSSPAQDNPLSQHHQSTWHQFFCDRELRSVIRQDVIRTFPGVDFFRDPGVQEAMVNVLFCYARENPTMCYRQGMHEVLAPLLFVLHSDHQAFLHTKEQAHVSPDICTLLDPNEMEGDSYTLFRRIMNAIEGSYLIADLAPTATGYFPPRASLPGQCENQVVSQLNWIKERLLAPYDPQLYQHLEQLDIPLPLFGIRWLRLMFGREFPLQDLLVLWDAIFADDSSFDLVNYIVVAMLIAIRANLLSSDYTACLTLLMRYPPSVDISFIIEYSLHLKEPKKYSVPSMKALPGGGGRSRSPERNRRPSKLVGKAVPRNFRQPRPPLPATPQTQKTVIDGYAPDDPALVVVELRNAYALISLCRLKLEQYHRVLEDAVPVDNVPAQDALTGIHELCSLLEPRWEMRGVEPAYEAGENGRLDMSPPLQSPPGPRRRKPSVDMTVFKHSVTPHPEPP